MFVHTCLERCWHGGHLWSKGCQGLKRQEQKLEFVEKLSITDHLTFCCNTVHGVFDTGRAHVRAWRARERLVVASLITRCCRHEGADCQDGRQSQGKRREESYLQDT